MAINQPTLAQVTSQIQAFGQQFNSLFVQVQDYYNFITSIGAAGLEAAPYSLSTTDANTLVSAATDLYRLGQVYQGLMYVAAGTTQNTGVPTANGASAFGYQFSLFVGRLDGFGF